MPGYTVLELDKMIFQELICEYCDTVVRDALRANCGHFYCRSCVDYLFRGNPGAVAYCKKSRTPLFYCQFSPDERISSEVESTTVHCLFLEAGCTWEGKLKESESHVGSCSLASIQRGEQKECESDETLSNETDDKRESLLSDNVVEGNYEQSIVFSLVEPGDNNLYRITLSCDSTILQPAKQLPVLSLG